MQFPELDTIFSFTHLWKFAIFLPTNKGMKLSFSPQINKKGTFFEALRFL